MCVRSVRGLLDRRLGSEVDDVRRAWGSRGPLTYDFSSCFFPKFKIMHFQNRDIKLYTVVLLFLCFLKFLLKLCCR